MTNWILRWILSGVALAIVANLHLGVSYKEPMALVIATVVIGLVNSLIKPVLMLLALPLNCMTFGMFGFILNALLFWVAGNSVHGFSVDWPLGALLGPVLMGLISGLLNSLLVDRGE